MPTTAAGGGWLVISRRTQSPHATFTWMAAPGAAGSVGQPFLQHAVSGPGGVPWYRADVTGDVELELDARLCGARQEVLDVLPGQRMFQGWGQQAGQPADVPGGFASQLGDVAEQLVGGRITGRQPLPGAGLDDHDADAVRDDIMQLPGYPGALVANGFRGELLTL